MERRNVNPWTWQDAFGFSQAVEFSGQQRVLVCAGQTSTSADGQPMHPGDMAAQIRQALDNLDTVLRQAGMSFSNLVRLNYYTTDPDALFPHMGIIGERLGAAGVQPAGTLLGVSRLAFPELMIEIEATAVA
jgi:enamine deaminase RidA (YjgF/YER057c/UK114 family)